MEPAPSEINIDMVRFKTDPADILPLLGEPADSPDPHTREIIEAITGECKRLMKPRGGYVMEVADGPRATTELKLRGITFHTGRIIGKELYGADIFAFFAGTAGAGPEELSRSLLEEGRYLEGYIADLVATAIVESVAEQIHGHIMKEATARGMKSTNRYSPGHCNWGVEDQQGLFTLFPPGFCGIGLSASSLMSPIKSVSGVVGIGRSVTYRDYPCELCSMTGCPYRRTRELNARAR
jgi:hypothetical protein